MKAAYALALELVVIGALTAINWWAFPHLLGRRYLTWDIGSGAGIALVLFLAVVGKG